MSLKQIQPSDKELTESQDNIFQTGKVVKGIFISYWIKKNKKEYGCFIMN